ncbi:MULTISPECIES: vWA domain-containing protein [Thalassospira]|uniref:vWA domain-containing protein n=1 Tax=Thalassospira TaxID=168934 RepID=UPI000C0DE2D7|nr:VWA domain-containing protein [Thalassospira sp. GB04J01]MBV18176.1 VWA domain-containing protein [Thalassospira sp.]|tara:strand:- start:44755 stop:45942 length:1188 start_codon:yes stop_codon:yes gene_type:complete
MFTGFFYKLKENRVPVSLREYLTLLEAVEKGLAGYSVEDFYYLARASLVKDERNLDKFDRVFSEHFKGVIDLADGMDEVAETEIPEEWLHKLAEKFLSEEEKAEIESLGGWEKLMETLKQRLEEQKSRHQGGNKWIGTAGTSPFGAYGYNPEGVRIGQDKSRHRRAVKVWDKREFKNLDDSVEIGTRNIKIALRRLRKWARTGAADELDLPGTITSTARQGWLDVQMRPERHNSVKVLMLFDIGGSMDDHIKVCEELFSAVKTEFKHLEYYYFHNCPYEGLWKDNARRRSDQVSTWDVINTYGSDYKLVIVGDATMSPYEITYPGGAVEHWNEEAGAVWMQRLLDHFDHAAWINPQVENWWPYHQSIQIMHQLMAGRMFPLTLDGLDRMTGELNR